MAVGISSGSTGMQEALDLLDPLLSDSVDFVRQGALIATALVLMQQPESKVKSQPLYSFCGCNRGLPDQCVQLQILG